MTISVTIHGMTRLFLLALVVLVPSLADAHWPIVRESVSQHAVETVRDPAWSRAYYGVLEGHPHTYEFTVAATSTIFIQTLLPDVPDDTVFTKPSGLLVEVLASGRVAEIIRLTPGEANWESEFEPFGGDRYLQGPLFRDELAPGIYRFEVSTPDNMTKYVLAIGDEERWSGTNPLTLLGRIYQVKQFYGKPWYAVWQSPFYYVPTIILLGILGFWYYRRQRRADS